MKNVIYFSLMSLIIVACRNNTNEDVDNSTNNIVGDVTMYITDVTRSNDFRKTSVNFVAAETDKIILDPATRYQTMRGFGAAITGATAYNLMKMSQENRTKFLTETFSPTEGMGSSYVRISIGCSDFSLSEYTCWENRDKGFALTTEEIDYVIPVLKEILAINPDLQILGSPWTCPTWMKDRTGDMDNDVWNGGTLKPEFYDEYANYFAEWINAFKQNGITITAVTPQNEPLHAGNSASLVMTWKEERDFVKDYLSPTLKPLGTKIYLYDHNYDYANSKYANSQDDYPARIYDAGVDDEVVIGAAYHNYGGSYDELNNMHSLYPNKELIFSEASIGGWNNGRDLSISLMSNMQNVFLETVNRWCTTVLVWNLMLDKNGAPNRPKGCTTCYGAVDIDERNYKSITRNSHYYCIGHMASVVSPGAIRINAKGYTANGLTYSAFENVDGTYSFVALNNSDSERRFFVGRDKHFFNCYMPAKSVVSCRWKK